ncbi:MAG: hypothetical protein WCO44_00175 [Bacteroidota bacterium]
MKTRRLLKKLIPAAILTMLILVLSIACRKTNDATNSTPAPTPTPASANAVVFTNRPIHIMSNFETMSQQEFPGHVINGIGGLKSSTPGVTAGPMKEVGKLIWDIAKNSVKVSPYDTINSMLLTLIGQTTILTNMITAMGNNLTLLATDVDKLTSCLSTGKLNDYISLIQSDMGNSDQTEFMFYAKTASDYKQNPQDPINIARMDFAKSKVRTYAENVYTDNAPTSMGKIIGLMKSELCPTIPGNNALRAYAKTLINACKGKIHDSTDAMNAYIMLESYFLTVVNYQFQAATIKVNAAYMYDSLHTLGLDTIFWNRTVVPSITPEISTFLSTVDYLAANLNEYRNEDHFVRDMPYATAGLAPDDFFYNPLARAQFVANLLTNGLVRHSPVMGGHITVPSRYGPDGTAPAANLTVTIGSKTLSANSTMMPSLIPYTWWTSDKVCSHDNIWNVYRFNSPDTTWATGKQTITVTDNGNLSPWTHYVPITGSVTPLYYNPKNPEQYSTTKTDLCTFQFGYFAAAWPWGYMALTNDPISNGWQSTGKLDCFDFSTFNSHITYIVNGTTARPPLAATTSSNYKLYYQTSGIAYTYPYNTPGLMKFSGTSSYTENYYIVVDNLYNKVKTSQETGIGWSLHAWAWYKAYYGMQGNGGVDMTVNIGTTIPEGIDWSVFVDYVGGDVVRRNFNNATGVWNSGFGFKDLPTDKAYTYYPGVQYYYQTANLMPGKVPASISLQTGYQFVFQGFNDVPD